MRRIALNSKAPRGIGHAGFSFVEVMLALGIAAFCLVPILAMLPIGLTSNKNTVEQTEAANLVSLIEADLRSAPKTTGAKSPVYQVAIPDNPAASVTVPAPLYLDEDAKPVTTPTSAKYRVTLSFGIASGRCATPLNILATWPTQVDPSQASGRFEAASSLDRN